jgi:hypothetical protein
MTSSLRARTPPLAIAPIASSSCPQAELADDEHVERRVEGTGDLEGHGNASPGQPEDE